MSTAKIVGYWSGPLNADQIPLVFTPEKLPHRPMQVSAMTMVQLMTEEANIIDRIAPMREQLGKVQAEIKKRKKLAIDSLSACCDSCADGKPCDSCH
jgi:hypothetical protein